MSIAALPAPLNGSQIAARLAGTAMAFVDANLSIIGNLDASKKMTFQVDTQATASILNLDVGSQTTSRTVTIPTLTGNGIFAMLGEAQTFTGVKTFSTPIAPGSGGTGVSNAGTFTNPANSSITGGGTLALGGFTLTVPATDTAALLGQTQTFTGAKTLTAPTTFTSASTSTSGITANPTIATPTFTYFNQFHPTATGTIAGALAGTSFWLTTDNAISASGQTLIGAELVARIGAQAGAGGGVCASIIGMQIAGDNFGVTTGTLIGLNLNATNAAGTATTATALSISVANGGTLTNGVCIDITANAGSGSQKAIQIAAGCGPIIQNDTTATTSPTTGAVQVAGGAGFGGNVYASGVVGSYAASNKIVRFRHDGSNGIMETVIGSGQLFCYSPDNAVVFQAGSAISLICIANTGAVVIATDPGGTDKLRVGGSLTISDTKLLTTKTAFTNGAAAAAGTLTNAPAAGNPTKWIPINDNGTTRYIPAW